MSIKSFQNNDVIETKIGEVQANPTENTVLERLKAIEDALVAVTDSAGSVLDTQLTGSLFAVAGTNRKGGSVSIAAGADALIWTPTAGNRIRLRNLLIGSDVLAHLALNTYNSSGTIKGEVLRFQASAGGNSQDYIPFQKYLETAVADDQIGIRNKGSATVVLIYNLAGEEF